MQLNKTTVYDQKKIKSKSFFNFLKRVDKLCVSNFYLRSHAKFFVSWEPTEAGVDFGMKIFSGKIYI